LISYGPPNFKIDAKMSDIISPSTKDKYSRINPICDNPKIIIQNSGEYNLKSLDIVYGFESKRKSHYFWKGDLKFLENDTINLPSIDWDLNSNNMQFSVQLRNPNGMKDENHQNNKLISIVQKPIILPKTFQLLIHTNNVNRARENSFSISNSDGMIFYSDEKFVDDTDYGYLIELNSGCYQVLLTDDMEDGISKHWWYRNSDPDKVGMNGSVKIISTNGKELHIFKSDFGQELRLNFVIN